MGEYYAVHRTGEELTHYGIRGMKWGVRKAIKSGNEQMFSRLYRKAARKLDRLQRKGESNGSHAVKAAALGAGAVASSLPVWGKHLSNATRLATPFLAAQGGYHALKAVTNKILENDGARYRARRRSEKLDQNMRKYKKKMNEQLKKRRISVQT